MCESERHNPSPTPANKTDVAPTHDPWEDTETAHLREFLKLTYTERFRLLMQAIEFMNMLRPIGSDDHAPKSNNR